MEGREVVSEEERGKSEGREDIRELRVERVEAGRRTKTT